jgi:Ulp1 family protease
MGIYCKATGTSIARTSPHLSWYSETRKTIEDDQPNLDMILEPAIESSPILISRSALMPPSPLPEEPSNQCQVQLGEGPTVNMMLEEAIESLNLESQPPIPQPHHDSSERSLRQITKSESDLVSHWLSLGQEADSDKKLAVPISQIGTHVINVRTMRSLCGNNYLNDDAIDGYLGLLNARDKIRVQTSGELPRHCLDAFFITQLLQLNHATDHGVYMYAKVATRRNRRFPNKNVFELDQLIIPINVNRIHWVCVAVSIPHRTITYHDSLGSPGDSYLQHILHYLKDEYEVIHGSRPTNHWSNEWQLLPGSEVNTPQQDNGFDCGMFTCANADCIMRGQPLAYAKHQLNGFREHIALALIKTEIPPWDKPFLEKTC